MRGPPGAQGPREHTAVLKNGKGNQAEGKACAEKGSGQEKGRTGP